MGIHLLFTDHCVPQVKKPRGRNASISVHILSKTISIDLGMLNVVCLVKDGHPGKDKVSALIQYEMPRSREECFEIVSCFLLYVSLN